MEGMRGGGWQREAWGREIDDWRRGGQGEVPQEKTKTKVITSRRRV